MFRGREGGWCVLKARVRVCVCCGRRVGRVVVLNGSCAGRFLHVLALLSVGESLLCACACLPAVSPVCVRVSYVRACLCLCVRVTPCAGEEASRVSDYDQGHGLLTKLVPPMEHAVGELAVARVAVLGLPPAAEGQGGGGDGGNEVLLRVFAADIEPRWRKLSE